jgi:1,4-dihydroxy-2-naphthoyl-CoA hydrolase
VRHFTDHVGTTLGRSRAVRVAAQQLGGAVGTDPTLEDLTSSSAFVAAASFVPDELSGSRVTGSLEVGPDHHTPWGVVHGGVYTTAIESAASVGASLAVRESGQFAVGLSNATDFIRPVRQGRLDVVAEPLVQGRTQQLWQVDIVRSDDGKRVAHGKVRLQNVPLDRS